MNITSKPGIYVHIPFCDTKCPYCDFYSITDERQISQFIKSILTEIRLRAATTECVQNFDTIYFGGGTPSVLPAQQIETILSALHKSFPIDSGTETTIEINPGTVDRTALAEIKGLGINRVSIGIQSFNDSELKTLGRIHSARQARESVLFAQQAGFENIGIDLIFAVPGQTYKSWRNSLESGIALDSHHVSAYNLTFESGTPFYELLQSGQIKAFNEESEKHFFVETAEILVRAGFVHYEVSNYARNKDYISRHNYKYWTHNSYLSFGPSAHSYFGGIRYANFRSLKKYLEYLENETFPVDFSEKLTAKDLLSEHLLLKLRTYDGINFDEFYQKFQFSFMNKYLILINRLAQNGLADLNKDNFRLTDAGMLISDEIIAQFNNN